MLLVLAIFSVAAVAVLGIMAHRYGSILERRREAERMSERRVARSTAPGGIADSASPKTAPTALPDGPGGEPSAEEEALRYVDAFIEVRRALEQVNLTRALQVAGIDAAEYTRVEKLYRAWKGGRRDIGGPFLAAFEKRREELEREAS
jgi:hypothetical protein